MLGVGTSNVRHEKRERPVHMNEEGLSGWPEWPQVLRTFSMVVRTSAMRRWLSSMRSTLALMADAASCGAAAAVAEWVGVDHVA